MGALWGRRRQASDSIVVSSVAHDVRNGLAYPLFGYGTKVGRLGVPATSLYGPEVGILGLALNSIALAVIWRITSTRNGVIDESVIQRI